MQLVVQLTPMLNYFLVSGLVSIKVYLRHTKWGFGGIQENNSLGNNSQPIHKQTHSL